MKHYVAELLALSSDLDESGLHQEADDIDQFAQEYSSELMPNPKFVEIFSSIKDLLKERGADQELLSAIDELQNTKYMSPAKPEKYVPEGMTPHFVPQDAMDIAYSYAELSKSIPELEMQMEEASNSGDDERYAGLKQELDSDTQALHSRWREMMEYKNTDSALFKKMVEYVGSVSGEDAKRDVALLKERRSENRRQ